MIRPGRLGMRTLAGGVACLAVLTLTASSAAAHSEPIELSPADGTTVADAPTQVTAVFSEELDPGSSLTVRDAAGRPVDDGGHLDLDDVAHVTLVADLDVGDGSYTVEWTAVSAEDGDETGGSWAFTVGDGGGTGAAALAASEDGGTDPLAVLAIVAIVAIAAGAISVTVALVRSRRARRVGAVE